MSLIEAAGLALLRRLDPETAHGLALKALRVGLAPSPGQIVTPRLTSRVLGMDFANPIGVAAGFDKNAEVPDRLIETGFGFVEVGAVTPRPQAGNPRPRLFRLTGDRAAINRFGFNNEGMAAVRPRLARDFTAPVGLNIGANKDSDDRPGDFIQVMETFDGLADFFTVNVSSPNTERLRDLQGRAALDSLLGRVMAARRATPVLLKIAPDLEARDLDDIADLAVKHGLSGIVATNTTLARDGLLSGHRDQAGGLSGAPLKARATAILGGLRRRLGPEMTLIGVGGVETAQDAYARIRAGAALVQLYTAMVYSGVSLGARIADGLDGLLKRDGFANVTEAIGVDVDGA